MSQDFEQIRASDRQQIQQLQANLEQLHQSSQTNQGLVTQHDELIEQLQSILALTEGTMIDISTFKMKALEINEKLEVAQAGSFSEGRCHPKMLSCSGPFPKGYLCQGKRGLLSPV
jgi:hypothetical protein